MSALVKKTSIGITFSHVLKKTDLIDHMTNQKILLSGHYFAANCCKIRIESDNAHKSKNITLSIDYERNFLNSDFFHIY